MANQPTAEKVDIREHGAPRQGSPQTSDRRLYMQLQVFGNCADPNPLIKSIESSGLECVLYLDVNDPSGVGILFMTEDPGNLVSQFRQLLTSGPFTLLHHKPDMTMTGRTYSTGRENDLEDWLFKKPRRNSRNPDWPWAIWYPLRRKPEFELLSKDEQSKILYEHAKIGISYGVSNLVHDIRIACFGIDKNDNEFVLGLVSSDLTPLSRVVQDMRKTQQTAKYMQSLGPFFIGKAIWQSPLQS